MMEKSCSEKQLLELVLSLKSMGRTNMKVADWKLRVRPNEDLHQADAYFKKESILIPAFWLVV